MSKLTELTINFIGALLIFAGIPIYVLHYMFGVNLKTSIMIGAAIAILPATVFGKPLYDQLKYSLLYKNNVKINKDKERIHQ